MTGFSEQENSVRVDFFKPSGKWYATEAVIFGPYKGCIKTAFRESLKKHLNGRMKGMMAVCPEPCHEHAHPQMLQIPEEGL